MDIGEIISDALVYPFKNIKALGLYIVLGIIVGIVATLTGVGIAIGNANHSFLQLGTSAAIGFIVLFILLLLIDGYTLDIVKFAIERRNDAPGIEPVRQIVNAIKLIIMDIIYYIIPVIITAILGLFLRNWLIILIATILLIIFTLAEFMARCRLAKSDSLGHALAIGETFGDISRVGLIKILATIIISAIILFIVYFIAFFIMRYIPLLGGILLGILGVYAVFFINRSIGLLYSDV